VRAFVGGVTSVSDYECDAINCKSLHAHYGPIGVRMTERTNDRMTIPVHVLYMYTCIVHVVDAVDS
jgi:hypothetical protein